MINNRAIVGVAVAVFLGIALAVALAACSQEPIAPTPTVIAGDRGGIKFVSPEEFVAEGVRSIEAGATAQPGLYWVWALPTQATPIARPTEDPYYSGNYPIGVDCLIYLSSTWPSEGTGNIDLSEIDACFNDTMTGTVKLGSGDSITLPVGLTLPAWFMQTGGSGTVGDPYDELLMPAWMSSMPTITEKFTSTGTTYYNGIHYDALQPYMIDYIDAVAAHTINSVAMANNPRLAYIRVFAGISGETQPVAKDNNDGTGITQAQLLARHEAELINCAGYKAFVVALGEAAAAAFPNTPIMVMAAPQPCASGNDYGYRRELFGNWAATPELIGNSMNGLVPDSSDAAGYPGATPEGWMKMDNGPVLSATGMPVGYEFRQPDPATVAGDDWQYVYWNFAAAMSHAGDYVFMQSAWRDYLSMNALNLIDRAIAGDVLAVIFRDYETPPFTWLVGYGYSGMPLDFGLHGTVLTPRAFAQVCNSSVQATATAAVRAYATAGYTVATPLACAGGALPTPAATLQTTPVMGDANMLQRVANRQARYLAGGQVMGIAADVGWSYYTTFQDMTVRITYLDTGTESFQVHTYLGGSSYQNHTVVKGNTGIWKTSSVTVTNAYVANGINIPAVGDAFITIANLGSNPLYLHELQADVTAAGDTPTPTNTATNTATPTNTVTPTQTFTPSPTLTPTPTGWPTPVYTVQMCPQLAVTVDATLSEWSAVTPEALSASNALYLFPDEADVVTASNFSMVAYCAYTGTTLYLSGVITDSVVLSGTGWIDNGDAVRLTVDGAADLLFKFREDDRELYFAPDDRSADFAIYPVADTLTTGITGTGWSWEVAITEDALGAGALTGGKQLLFTWAYVDRDTGSTWDHVIVAYPRSGQLQ